MLSGNSWANLASRLLRLDITFPSAHSINSYSLPLTDFTRLMQVMTIIMTKPHV